MRSSTLTPSSRLQIANLGRREIVVEDDHVGVRGPHHQLKLLELAFADDTSFDRGSRAFLRQPADHFGPGGFHEPGQLFQVVAAGLAIGQLDADQYGRLALYAVITIEFCHY